MKPIIQTWLTVAVIISAFMLLAAPPSFAADDDPVHFSPSLFNEEILPQGIIYMNTGPVHAMRKEGIVVDDTLYPLATKAEFFNQDGTKATINSLYKGKKVDVYVNEKHEAVYVVLK